MGAPRRILLAALVLSGCGTRGETVVDASFSFDAGARGMDASADASSVDASSTDSGSASDALSRLDTFRPPPSVIRIDTGSLHSCVLWSTGLVDCWGTNGSGQIGTGTTSPLIHPLPVRVTGVEDGRDLAVGGEFTCVVFQTGTATCWGRNGFGELGDGTTTNQLVPTPLSGVGEAARLYPGRWQTFLLEKTGDVLGWGRNEHGQLGDGLTDDRLVPAVLPLLRTFDQISGGFSHSCGVDHATGVANCWGFGATGRLGNGTYDDHLSPAPVVDITDVAGVSAGFLHSCAWTRSGQVYCWGGNDALRVGIDSPTREYTRPVLLAGLSSIQKVDAGDAHSCALDDTGQVYCWGYNSQGDLGRGATGPPAPPGPVPGLSDVTDLSVGGNHSCALRRSGQVVCWGQGTQGQLGDGLSENSATPVAVTLTPP